MKSVKCLSWPKMIIFFCWTIFLTDRAIQLKKYNRYLVNATVPDHAGFQSIQDGGGEPSPPPAPLHTSFSFVTSKNVGFGSQNFLNFSFNSFATLVQNFKLVPGASPKLLNLNQANKKRFFWSNPYMLRL